MRYLRRVERSPSEKEAPQRTGSEATSKSKRRISQLAQLHGGKLALTAGRERAHALSRAGAERFDDARLEAFRKTKEAVPWTNASVALPRGGSPGRDACVENPRANR